MNRCTGLLIVFCWAVFFAFILISAFSVKRKEG